MRQTNSQPCHRGARESVLLTVGRRLARHVQTLHLPCWRGANCPATAHIGAVTVVAALKPDQTSKGGMKHRNTRELYDYWSRLRGANAAPQRGAIEPAEIHGLLGDTFILESAGPTQYPFRLAGTRLCSHFGRELKGRNFLTLWGDEDIEAIDTLLTAVCVDAAAAVIGVETLNDRGQTAPWEMVVLPLSRGGKLYDRILGLMAPLERPYWLDIHPVIRQSITSLRLIWPDERPVLLHPSIPAPGAPMLRRSLREDALPEMPAGALTGGRRHHHLVVFDGGKS